MVPQQTPTELIWRDDDISAQTNVWELLLADDVLRAAGLRHTVAVIAKDIEDHVELIDAIRERRMDVQLHCWTHDDLTIDRESLRNLASGVETIEQVFGQRPTVLYPPWNRADGMVYEVAESLGLRVSNQKVSLQKYIKVGGDVAEDVVNFHYWSEEERALLLEAIDVFRRRRHR